MSRKAITRKPLTEKDLLGILSDTIRNVNNNTLDTKQAREIFSGARAMCQVVSTKLKVMKYSQDSGSETKFLD
jgi:hypothetical protein